MSAASWSGSSPISTIAAGLNLSRSTVKRALDDLVKAGAGGEIQLFKAGDQEWLLLVDIPLGETSWERTARPWLTL